MRTTLRFILAYGILTVFVPVLLNGLSKIQSLFIDTYYIGSRVPPYSNIVSGSLMVFFFLGWILLLFPLGMFLRLKGKSDKLPVGTANYMYFAITPLVSFVVGTCYRSGMYILAVNGYGSLLASSFQNSITIIVYGILYFVGKAYFLKRLARRAEELRLAAVFSQDMTGDA